MKQESTAFLPLGVVLVLFVGVIQAGCCLPMMGSMMARPRDDPGDETRAEAQGDLAVTFSTIPDPPRPGENEFEVTVRDRTGAPVSDADVSVVFSMSAMPSMNMPPMSDDTRLEPVGEGVYRGTGRIAMAGRWQVTVRVTHGGHQIGVRRLTAEAR